MKASNGEFSQLDEEGHDLRPLGHDVRVGRTRQPVDGDEEMEESPPEGGINVKTEVEVAIEVRVVDYNDRLF